MWMMEKRPFWASKVMPGIPHILEMKHAIFKNVNVPEKHASHQPARSCKPFGALEHLNIVSCFAFPSCWLLLRHMFYLFPEAGITVQCISQILISTDVRNRQHTSLHSQLQKPANKVNYVGIAPSAASGQNVVFYFFSARSFSVSELQQNSYQKG